MEFLLIPGLIALCLILTIHIKEIWSANAGHELKQIYSKFRAALNDLAKLIKDLTVVGSTVYAIIKITKLRVVIATLTPFLKWLLVIAASVLNF